MGESGAARSGLRISVRAMRKRWRRASTGQVSHANHSDAKGEDTRFHNLVETIPMALLFGGRAFSEERKTFTKRP